MTETLEESVAIITGSSSGIGWTTARALAEEGASVVLAARREQRLKELSEAIEAETPGSALVVPTDVMDRSEVEHLVDQTVTTFNRLDIVVNNAGVGRPGDVEQMSDEDYHTVMDVNVTGIFYVTRASLPHLRKTHGNLIFLGSFYGKHPFPSNPLYAATKWWIRGFALSLQGQVGKDNIAITVVHPSEVRTEWGANYQEAPSKDRYEAGTVTEPEDVADVILVAVKQEPPNTITEIDVVRRDKLSDEFR